MSGKSDCAAAYAPGPPPLRISLRSSVAALFGRAIEAAALAAASELGAGSGELAIEDDGALDYVVAARVEAALRAAGFARGPRPEERPAPDGAADGAAEGAARRRRSRLYIPGDQPDLMPNAGLFGADCLVLDLEDSVHPGRKREARILLRRALESHRAFFGSSEIAVRINALSGPYGEADLDELSSCPPDAIILPKCESAREVLELCGRLDAAGAAPPSPRATLVIPLIETARGVLAAPAIAAASPRVAALSFGAEDFARDIGARRTGAESLLARQAIVLAASAAGIRALDSVYPEVDDPEGLAAYCAESRALGFEGIGLVHPRQIEIAHRAFEPTDEELAEALGIVAALDEAGKRGSGVAALGGRMIDAPVAERARRVVAARAKRIVAERGASA